MPLAEAAHTLGRSPQYIRKATCRARAGLPAPAEGRLPWLKIGARLFIKSEALEAYLATCDGTPCAMSSARIDAPNNAKREPAELRIVTGEQP